MAKDIENIIPDQETGSKTDTHYTVNANDVQSAKEIFHIAKERLQNVNEWHHLCGSPSAEFSLTDSNGNIVTRKPQKGDHFRINLPAPGPKAGDGSDWVMIEEIEDRSDPGDASEAFAIRVRPAPNPVKSEKENVAHFFKDAATSSFTVEREGNEVTASVHGRNEEANTETQGVVDKVRNAVVAIGAILGMSNTQWKSLVKGLLEKK